MNPLPDRVAIRHTAGMFLQPLLAISIQQLTDLRADAPMAPLAPTRPASGRDPILGRVLTLVAPINASMYKSLKRFQHIA